MPDAPFPIPHSPYPIPQFGIRAKTFRQKQQWGEWEPSAWFAEAFELLWEFDPPYESCTVRKQSPRCPKYAARPSIEASRDPASNAGCCRSIGKHERLGAELPGD